MELFHSYVKRAPALRAYRRREVWQWRSYTMWNILDIFLMYNNTKTPGFCYRLLLFVIIYDILSTNVAIYMSS